MLPLGRCSVCLVPFEGVPQGDADRMKTLALSLADVVVRGVKDIQKCTGCKESFAKYLKRNRIKLFDYDEALRSPKSSAASDFRCVNRDKGLCLSTPLSLSLGIDQR